MNKSGDTIKTTYQGALITGKVVHREGASLLVKVTATSDPTIVKVGQNVIVPA